MSANAIELISQGLQAAAWLLGAAGVTYLVVHPVANRQRQENRHKGGNR